jgi:transposase-like protein
MIQYCPYCGSKAIKTIGISGIGAIRKCESCTKEFVVTENEESEQY